MSRYEARGVVQSVQRETREIIIRHEAISNYMAAMTMSFHVKSPDELAHLERGDAVTFQLLVTATESWVERLTKTGTAALPSASPPAAQAPMHSLRDYHFTNELGQAVSLNDFHGQVLAITFFYTRCPLPEYCPRLAKNFQAVQQQFRAMTNAPANWHLLSVSLDPQFDSPAMLRSYGQMYQADPAHWSFLTGPPDKIKQLAQQSGVTYETDGNAINHNFSTLIVDAAGHLQTRFPVGGDLSEAIVSELLKAAALTNPWTATEQARQ